MKKTSFILIVCMFFACMAFAQKGNVVITGKLITGDIVTPIHLQNMTGANFTIPVNAGGSFNAKLNITQKGFYTMDVIGRIYLEPGYDLRIMPGADSSYRFSGKGSFENNAPADVRKSLSKYMAVDETFVLGQQALNMSFPEHKSRIDAFVKDGQAILNRSTSAFFRDVAGKDLLFYGKYLSYTYGLYYGYNLANQKLVTRIMEESGSGDKRVSELAKSIKLKNLPDEVRKSLDTTVYIDWSKEDTLLYQQSAWYQKLIDLYFGYTLHTKFRKQLAESFRSMDADPGILLNIAAARQEFTAPFIREYQLYTYTSAAIKLLKNEKTRDSVYNDYITATQNPVYLHSIHGIYNNYITYRDGAMAPDFSFEDPSGKQVSLKDFRGQYVYIDVWATWCEPCKKEIPHLAKITETFNGKNIRFISISADDQKDKQKWKRFVQDGKLGGVQLIADRDFNSDFIKKFNINSVPRFILISPEGKIVNGKALRPSNPDLRLQLERLL